MFRMDIEGPWLWGCGVIGLGRPMNFEINILIPEYHDMKTYKPS
jgi:hypothetical protein